MEIANECRIGGDGGVKVYLVAWKSAKEGGGYRVA